MKRTVFLVLLLTTFIFANSFDEAEKLFEAKQYTKAIELFKQDQSSPVAQYYLGKAYLYGLGVEIDKNKAFEYAKKSAKAKYPAGINLLGAIYMNGDGVEKDEHKAFKYYEEAAQLKNPRAILNVASMYFSGIYVEKDINKSIFWTTKAYNLGNTRATELLGLLYANEEIRNYQQAIKYLEEYINLTDATDLAYVYLRLGDMYKNLNNLEKAFYYYNKSSKLGNDDAIFIIYMHYVYETHEYVKAIKLATEAYSRGNINMGCNLASYYSSLRGNYEQNPDVDFEKAYNLANTIIAKNPIAKYNSLCYSTLAGMYELGNYLVQDINQSIKLRIQDYKYHPWQKGNPAAIADLYLTELHDYENAQKWYKKAYELTGDKTLLTKVEEFKRSLPTYKSKDLNTTKQKIYPIINNFSKKEQAVSYLESKKYYFIATDQKSIKIYDKKTLDLKKELSGWIGDGFVGMITQMAYDEKRHLLYCTPLYSATDFSKNDTILVFDITTGKIVKALNNKNAQKSIYLNISKDGKYLVSINRDTLLNIINTDTDKIQHYSFANIVNFTKANITQKDNDYLVNVLANDKNLYTFSVKQKREILKAPFAYQTTFKTFNGPHALGIFKNRFCHISNIVFKNNFLYIKNTQDTINRFDVTKLKLTNINKKIDFSYNYKSSIEIKYKNQNSSVEVYKNKKLITNIEFYNTPVLSYKVINDKYIVITTNDISSMYIFNLSGRPIAKLIGFNALQTNILYQNGYLITYGADDVIHLWNLENLDKFNQMPEQYDKEILQGLSNASNGENALEIFNESDDDIKSNLQSGRKQNNLSYVPTPKQFRLYMKMFLLKKASIYPMASLYIKNDKDWIIYTHKGLFTYGGKGKDLLKYHQNQGLYKEARIVENDKLFDKFYRPDLIKKILAGKKVTIPMDVKSVLLNIKPPKLSLLQHNMLNDKDVELTYQICDAGNGIADPKLLINGQAINPPNSRGFSIKKVKLKNKSCKIYRSVLTLDPGTNTISFKAYDKDKNIANSSKILKIVANYIINNQTKSYSSHNVKIDDSEQKGDLYFLTIAISNYEKSEFDLKYSVKDAKAVQKNYLEKNKNSFNYIHTFNLYDNNVSKETLTKTFDEISKKIKYGDTFLLYIAGHGTYKDGKYQLIPYKINKKISIDFLKENLSKIYTNKYLVLLDTCKSGAAIDSIYDEATKNRLAHDSAKINYIVSSSANQVALEGYKGHGVFTYSVIDALKNNSELNVFKLANIVTDTVPRISKEKFYFKQIPQVKLNQNFSLIHPY
jgi:TPR repeat protein